MGNIVDARHHTLASGWKRVISVLAIAADSGNEELVVLAFSIVTKICVHHFKVRHAAFCAAALELLKRWQVNHA